MEESLILILRIIALTVSLILLGVSFKWPGFGRVLFVVLFLWASYTNAKTAIMDPQGYLNYASFAWLQIYKDFISGFFAKNITTTVLTIAFFQFLIAILLSSTGQFVKWGGWMAVIFLVAIAPLGVGSGFPSSLIMAAAIIVIIRKPVTHNLWKLFVDKMHVLRISSSNRKP